MPGRARRRQRRGGRGAGTRGEGEGWGTAPVASLGEGDVGGTRGAVIPSSEFVSKKTFLVNLYFLLAFASHLNLLI